MLRSLDLYKTKNLPRHELDLTLAHILNIPRLEIYLNNPEISDLHYSKIDNILKRRIAGEPLQYLLGEVEFYGLPFKINKNVLIPRPETEILVDAVIAQYKTIKNEIKLLDLCTGSGNIAVALAKNINCKVTAADISAQALKIAENNAILNEVQGKIKFFKSDLFNNVKNKFDLITINPPYIPSGEIPRLQKELAYEPALALDGGKDGLDFYRKIIKEVPKFLLQGSCAFIEMGDNQAIELKKILKGNKDLKINRIIEDYNQKPRVLVIERI